MANTYQLIEAKTLGTATASVTFSSIPGTFTDLTLLISSRSAFTTFANDPILVNFNGSTSNFSAIYLSTNGGSVYSGPFARDFGNSTSNSATSNTFSNNSIYIPNYTSSNYKSYSVDVVTENNATAIDMAFVAGLWSNTAAITSIALTHNSGLNFLQYSSFYLYGIKNS